MIPGEGYGTGEVFQGLIDAIFDHLQPAVYQVARRSRVVLANISECFDKDIVRRVELKHSVIKAPEMKEPIKYCLTDNDVGIYEYSLRHGSQHTCLGH
ncbi:MAG: hypothetical protein L0H93_06245 [Nocardioides sp.]|nr:hypothetical protein [Nocardioides sp.]